MQRLCALVLLGEERCNALCIVIVQGVPESLQHRRHLKTLDPRIATPTRLLPSTCSHLVPASRVALRWAQTTTHGWDILGKPAGPDCGLRPLVAIEPACDSGRKRIPHQTRAHTQRGARDAASEGGSQDPATGRPTIMDPSRAGANVSAV